MREYFAMCNDVVSQWRLECPKFLEPESDPTKQGFPNPPLDSELDSPHGVYLFRHRNLPIRYFPPNFHPPYNTPEKREIIASVLQKQWNERTLQWE